MNEVRRYRVWVEGRVQGVGYRMFAARRARGLGIGGYVRNLPDGRVEAVAEGRAAALEVFLKELRKGPRRARVDRIECTPEPPTGEFGGFAIKG